MKAIMMISRTHIDKKAFGPKRQARASFIVMILTVFMTVSLSLAVEGYGIGNSRVGSRVSSPVERFKGPPTSIRDGLIQSPTMEKYQNQNLGMTGNVASGREFKGFVPYGSATDFQAPLGSAQLNSFIRNSTRTPYNLLSAGGAQPYYLPSKTVASTWRGGASGLEAPVILPQSRTPVYAHPSTAPKIILPLTIEQPMRGRKRPFAFDSDEIAFKLAKKAKNNNLQIADELLYDQDRAAEIKKILREFDEQESEKFEAEVLRKLQMKKSELEEPDLPVFRKEEVTDEVGKKPETETEAETERKSLEKRTEELTKFIEEELGITPREDKNKKAEGLPSETEPVKQDQTFQEQLDDMVYVDHERAVELLGEHKDFESLARTKFATYRELADEFMKKGKYYDARDSWKLAEIWISDHPDSAMGKGNALFAAGEYLSSAYYIELALASSPEYARKKNNLFQLVDQATIKSQMSELTSVYNISKSYKLGFLLAHLNYQENKLDKAAEYLVAIKEQMNQSRGYRNLKKVVEMAIAQEGNK